MHLARFKFTTCNPRVPALQISHLLNRAGNAESTALRRSKLFTTAAVRAFRHLFAKRARRSRAAINRIRDSQQPSGNKEAVGDELYPKNSAARRECSLLLLPTSTVLSPSSSLLSLSFLFRLCKPPGHFSGFRIALFVEDHPADARSRAIAARRTLSGRISLLEIASGEFVRLLPPLTAVLY